MASEIEVAGLISQRQLLIFHNNLLKNKKHTKDLKKREMNCIIKIKIYSTIIVTFAKSS